MDQDNIKRKSVNDATQEAPDHKIRKVNSIESASCPGVTHKSTVTAKFVDLWKKGLYRTTLEGQDNSFNAQEIDGKYREAVQMIEYLKKRLDASQENSRELSISIKEITAENETLRDKLSMGGTLTNDIFNVVEYMRNTLDRNKEQFEDLRLIKVLNETLEEEKENLNNAIIQLNEKLNTIEKKNRDVLNSKDTKLIELKSQFDEMKLKIKEQTEQIDTINIKLKERQQEIVVMKSNEDKLRNMITDLERLLSEEKNKIDSLILNTDEEIKKINETYEKKLFEANQNSEMVGIEVKTLREEKDNMAKILEEKTNSIKFFEKKNEEYEEKVKALLEQVSEIKVNLQQCVHEKNKIKKQLEEKDNELVQSTENINSLSIDKKLLNDELESFNQKLIHEKEKQAKLADVLKQKNIELQEALRKNQEIEKNYQNNDDSKDSVINQLKQDMKKMEKRLNDITIELTLERQEANKNIIELEKNYAKEINDLTTRCEKYMASYYQASKAKNDIIQENSESKANLKTVTNNLNLQKEVYNKKIEEMKIELEKKSAHINELEDSLKKVNVSLEDLEKKNKELEASQNKENGSQYLLEEKISCLGAMVKNLSQEMVNKNVRIKKDEITTLRSPMKSILKSPATEKSFKPPKSPGKKISFVNYHNQYDSFNIPRSQPVNVMNKDNKDLLISQSSQPITPSLSNTSKQSTSLSTPRKFFKSKASQQK